MEGRDRLAINGYLQQLTDPKLAFSVRQICPDTLDGAVAAMLQMESYLMISRVGTMAMVQPEGVKDVSNKCR